MVGRELTALLCRAWDEANEVQKAMMIELGLYALGLIGIIGLALLSCKMDGKE